MPKITKHFGPSTPPGEPGPSPEQYPSRRQVREEQEAAERAKALAAQEAAAAEGAGPSAAAPAEPVEAGPEEVAAPALPEGAGAELTVAATAEVTRPAIVGESGPETVKLTEDGAVRPRPRPRKSRQP